MTNFIKPMLAMTYDENLLNPKLKYIIQEKCDGHRCLITNVGGNKIAYSRAGKIYNNIDHILEGLSLPKGVTVDGELYIHGEKLQTISSLIRRKQDRTEELTYVLYDVVCGLPYDERYDRIQQIYFDSSNMIKLIDYIEINSPKDVEIVFKALIKAGYEGGIVRELSSGYEYGKRSKSLLKVKKKLDSEFLIKGIELTDTLRTRILCETENGELFYVMSPGTVSERKEAFKSREKELGNYIKVKYAGLSSRGVPIHPIAIGYMSDLVVDSL